MKEKYKKIKRIVEKELSCSAHAMDHMIRVYKLCLNLAKYESDIDLDILKTAALLHDIARVKEDKDNSGSIDHAIIGAKMAENILRDLNYSEEKIKQIKHCIATHRFRSKDEPETKEAKILFDADRLDAIGAIGIVRACIISGQYGQKIYSDIPIDKYIGENIVGKKRNGRIKDMSKHALNLEYEMKLKHIPEKIYTKKAKKIAKKRFKFMERFFKRLKREINGEI
jgi:uncharacterized protein